MPKLSLITSFLGQTKDRFHTYNQPKTLEEKFQLMATVPGFDGVELIHPYEVNDPVATRSLLDRYGYKMAAVNVNVKGEPEFVSGGLTSFKPEVRRKAIQYLKNAKDFALSVGADKVTCCPLGDGYEFAFQYDYRKTWAWLVEAFGEAASYRPEMPLFIEYKPSETRAACFLENAAKTVCLIKQTGAKNLGVTLDFGHSIYGNETPAEALCLLYDSGVPAYIHINDNNGKWDWDFFCGTKHILEYLEFLFYAHKFGYNDYFTSDTSPTRWDIARTFAANGRLTTRIWNWLEAGGAKELEGLIGAEDYLASWEKIEASVFGFNPK